jgi:hypothetical protein
MAIYRLRREVDGHTFDDVDASNAEHALAIFSRQTGVALTLNPGPAAPQFMMGLIEKGLHWAKPLDISVWERPPSN